MKQHLPILLLILGLSTGASAKPLAMNGNWEVIFPCVESPSASENHCSSDDFDYFRLRLWVKGSRLCGFHEASSNLQKRTDNGEDIDGNPTVTGEISAGVARIRVRTTRSDNEVVEAKLLINDRKLIWTKIGPTGGASLSPDVATLQKQIPQENQSEIEKMEREAIACRVELSNRRESKSHVHQ